MCVKLKTFQKKNLHPHLIELEVHTYRKSHEKGSQKTQRRNVTKETSDFINVLQIDRLTFLIDPIITLITICFFFILPRSTDNRVTVTNWTHADEEILPIVRLNSGEETKNESIEV